MDFATLVTAFVTAALLPWLSKHGVTLTADNAAWLTGLIVGAPTAIVHWIETRLKGGSKPLPAPSATSVAKVLPLLLVAGLTMLCLQGCATWNNLINTPSVEQQLIQSGVELAASAALDAVPAQDRAKDAQAITGAAAAVKAAVGSTSVAIGELQTIAATALAKTQLDPVQQQLITQIVATAATIGIAKVTAGAIDPATTLSVGTLMDWITAGVKPYTTVQAKARLALKVRVGFVAPSHGFTADSAALTADSR